MIIWHDNVRSGPGIGEKLDDIRTCVDKRKFKLLRFYCILFGPFNGGRLEIHNMGELLFKVYRDCPEEVRIIGVASSKSDALKLLEDIYDEVYRATGDVDVRSYFEKIGEVSFDECRTGDT